MNYFIPKSNFTRKGGGEHNGNWKDLVLTWAHRINWIIAKPKITSAYNDYLNYFIPKSNFIRKGEGELNGNWKDLVVTWARKIDWIIVKPKTSWDYFEICARGLTSCYKLQSSKVIYNLGILDEIPLGSLCMYIASPPPGPQVTYDSCMF